MTEQEAGRAENYIKLVCRRFLTNTGELFIVVFYHLQQFSIDKRKAA